MDKPLSYNEKNNQPEQVIGAAGSGSCKLCPAGIGAYSAGSSYNAALSEKSWTEMPLKDSVAGRGVIRLFSRGVMGTTAFALGGYYATKQMKTYGLEKPIENWLQGIARFVDKTAGVSIKKTVDFLGKDGEKFVNNFRPTAKFEGYGGKFGRSLGHDVVMVTFDFASMSVGDFWGRKIAQTLDPHHDKLKWKREDGSIDWAQATKTFGKNWWSALSYSQGEDWAVAIPYCLTMRHIGTPAINKMFPGYKYDFDRGLNGGSMFVNEHGKITGNSTAAGVLNIWERFTTYNVGTLLFREAYAWTGNNIKHLWTNHELPPLVEAVPGHKHDTIAETVVDGAKQFGNWLTRGSIKAVMYMIPAVPFFWVTRIPQHKFQGAFIHPDKGALMFGNDVLHTKFDAARHDPELLKKAIFSDGLLLRANTKQELLAGKRFFFSDHPMQSVVSPFASGLVDHNAKSWGWFDGVLRPIAKANDKVRSALRGPVSKIHSATFKKFKPFKEMDTIASADVYINAAIAYTPYFFAKSDWLANKLDYGRMDAAVDRTIAGAITFNPGEFKSGVGEIWQAVKQQPLKEPVREKYAQCLEATDSSPSDNSFAVNPNAGGSCDYLLVQPQKKAPIAPKQQLSFRERMVQGKPEDMLETNANKRRSFAEKEELKKLLEQSTPPTNSVN